MSDWVTQIRPTLSTDYEAIINVNFKKALQVRSLSYQMQKELPPILGCLNFTTCFLDTHTHTHKHYLSSMKWTWSIINSSPVLGPNQRGYVPTCMKRVSNSQTSSRTHKHRDPPPCNTPCGQHSLTATEPSIPKVL